jgi:hypothetical protein
MYPAKRTFCTFDDSFEGSREIGHFEIDETVAWKTWSSIFVAWDVDA